MRRKDSKGGNFIRGFQHVKLFWSLPFKDACLHIPYSLLLSSIIEYQPAPMLELLLEIVLVYRLHVNTVGHFWVSFSAHVAFDMDLYTAKYSGGDTWCWGGVVFLLFYLHTLEP